MYYQILTLTLPSSLVMAVHLDIIALKMVLILLIYFNTFKTLLHIYQTFYLSRVCSFNTIIFTYIAFSAFRA